MKTKPTFMLTAMLFSFIFCSVQTFAQKEIAPYYGEAGITKKISELPPAVVKKRLDSTAIRPIRSYFKNYPGVIIPKGKGTGIPLTNKGSEGNEADESQPLQSSSPALVDNSTLSQIHSNYLAVDFYEYATGWPP